MKETLSKQKVKPAAVYITSPDYLGNTADIAALSQIAHSFGVPLLCDNAHGAYLHFYVRNATLWSSERIFAVIPRTRRCPF